MRRLLTTLLVLVLANPAQAAITYVGGQAGTFAGTTSTQTITFSLTNGSASTPAANDLVIVTFAVASAAGNLTLDIETTGAVDYTLIESELWADFGVDTNLRVAYRFMPGTPETQFRFAGGSLNTANAACWSVHVFRGVDSTTPLDVAATTATATQTRVVDPPSITPTTDGAWILVTGAGAGATGGTYTTSGLTDFRANTQVDTNDCLLGAGYVTWTSGAYDHAAYGGGGTSTVNDTWGSVVAALRPFVAAAGCGTTVALTGAGCK